MSDPLLRVRNLSKRYDSNDSVVEVLNGASLDLSAGTSMALQGESGSGKSTLLHLIAGLDRADGGEIIFDGRDLAALSDRARAKLRREEIAIIFQQFNLIPSITVRANLAFHAQLGGRYEAAHVDALAERLGLDSLGDRYPDEISGGQRQRVAIGRAMALQPKLLLADEPTGNLDEDNADRVLDAFLSLVSDQNCALLMVTHSPLIAARLDERRLLRRGVISA